jgi:MFS family permease
VPDAPSIWRDRELRLALSANFVNFVGIGVAGIAVAWLLLQLTGSPESVGLMLVARAVPGLAVAGHAGALADRFDRRKLCLFSAALAALAELGLVAFGRHGGVTTGWIYLMTAVVAVGNAYFFPALRAHVQSVAGSERLMAANSAMETTMQVGAIAGAGIAGAVIAGFGTLGALAIDAASFLAAGGLIVLMAHVPLPARADAHPNSFAEQLSGFRYIASQRALAVTLGLLALPILCIQFDNVLIGPFVKDVLGLGPGAYGIANATYSSGATVSSIGLLVLAKRKADSGVFIAAVLVLLGLAHLGIGISPTLAVMTIATFSVGITMVVARTVLATHLMHLSEPAFAGRVQGTVVFVQAALVLFCGLVVGLGASRYGIRPAYVTLGALVAACGLLPLVRRRAAPAATPTTRESTSAAS